MRKECAFTRRMAGTLLSYHYDRGQKAFRMEYESSGEGETVIYCPFTPAELKPGEEAAADIVPAEDGSEACYIMVKAPKGRQLITLS